jgi:hypothetical protein
MLSQALPVNCEMPGAARLGGKRINGHWGGATAAHIEPDAGNDGLLLGVSALGQFFL